MTEVPLIDGRQQQGCHIFTDGWRPWRRIESGAELTIAGVRESYHVWENTRANWRGNARLLLTKPMLDTPADNAMIRLL